MSLTIKITPPAIDAAAQTEQLTAAMRGLGPKRAIGRGVAELFRRHLFAYNQSHPNKLGGSRTNFYTAAGRATSHEVTPTGILISIAKLGIRQRLLGGTITPRQKKFLTIPAVPEAHGKRAGEFSNLKFAYAETPSGAMAPALVVKENTTGLRPRGGAKSPPGRAIFWLSKRVYQQPDPGVLPDVAEIRRAADTSWREWVNGWLAKSRQNLGRRNPDA